MASAKLAFLLGLLAVAISVFCTRILPPGAVSWSNFHIPKNTLSMLCHYGAAKFGHLRTTGQVGDGREAYVLTYLQKNVPPGNPKSVLDAIDELAWSTTFLMNVGPDKGLILDKELQERKPCTALEIGAYVGYSAVRIGSQLRKGCKLYSVEFNAENADVARGVVKHAGLEETVEVITGTLGTTAEMLRDEKGVSTFDFVFLDHFKQYYLPDLKLLLEKGLLGKGSVIVADNVGFPGAPDYLKFVENNEEFETTIHETMLEYSKTVKDLVVVSVYKGPTSTVCDDRSVQ